MMRSALCVCVYPTIRCMHTMAFRVGAQLSTRYKMHRVTINNQCAVLSLARAHAPIGSMHSTENSTAFRVSLFRHSALALLLIE